ncbi:protein MLN51 homolog [Salvia splendens]|uniref:protein MLN51 homolog n=1 Tax=Salvia splendens TaxID=180675 RepID=UPI001C2771D2|nr:protein MLN51 homolog [Salvia splendens]XP_042061984.1 protein MLN51 homolog [Salvia splendens]XP_042061985.1 protein MLN51 homolog [Salvia splendens]XP_042061986.1 protein MLN51 homolog [Salvia splendens]
MAAEEVEYESDPEEAKLSLKMRRREASDDEEEAEQGGKPPRRIESDGESEGAVAEYEEELDDYDLDEEDIGKDVAEVVAVEREESESERERNFEGNVDAGENNDGDKNAGDGEHEEEKKEVEPFSVPTAGAFYMHDDRFRDNAGGRNRRTLGGRKLWESQSQDDRKWGHDKFEELTMQERHHEQGRRGARGRHRGRNRNRATDTGFAQVNRPKEYTNNSTDNNNYQGSAPKGVRGRGPRRYQPSFKNNNDSPATQNKYPGKSIEKHSHVSSRRSSEPVSNAKPDVVPRKQVASNLNIASPPFYPTGSSTKDNTAPPKRDVHASTVNRGQQPVVGGNFTMSQSTATMRGKNIVESIGQPQLRGQVRGPGSFTQMAYQPVVSNNQHDRVPLPNQQQNVQRNSGQIRAQSSLQGSSQQFKQRVPSNSQAFSPPKAAGSVNTSESGDVESASELNQPKTALVAKGKGSAPGSTKGSFLYGGAQVMGSSASMGSGPGDQNFPAFLPVMQFGGQHPIGVPAVGMAFPGYVGQPQLGSLGSSEMTWLPVLAGAAGALGATYCPQYLTVDGSYNARPSGQASSTEAASSKENSSATKGPSQRPDPANDDFGQRQKNPRRYTEMKFDQ